LKSNLRLLDKAAQKNPDFICFSELSTTPYFPMSEYDNEYFEWAEPIPGPTTSVLAEKAVPILEKAGVEVPWDLLHEAGRERRVARTEEILVTQEDWGCGPQPLFRALADEFGGDKSVAIIEKALTNKQPSVRSAAAYALGTVGGPKAVPPLEKALIDGDPTVRSSAAWALGHIRGRSARDLLIAKLEVERDPTVYGVIHTTLKRAFPEDPVVTEALAKAPPISP